MGRLNIGVPQRDEILIAQNDDHPTAAQQASVANIIAADVLGLACLTGVWVSERVIGFRHSGWVDSVPSPGGASGNAPLVVDQVGNMLLGVQPGAEGAIGHLIDGPLPLALVTLWQGPLLLLVFNRVRQVWELPGGMIEPGESPRGAAVRELQEETGHTVDDLRFAGVATFALRDPTRIEHAAIFTGHAHDCDVSFTPNEEISETRWWDGRDPIGKVALLDSALARYVRGHGGGVHVVPDG